MAAGAGEVGDLRYDTGSDTQLPTSHDRNPHLTLVINELRSAQYGYVKTRVYAGLSRWVFRDCGQTGTIS